jgi:hypothetical protein
MKERDRLDPNHLQKTLLPISHGFMCGPVCHTKWELRIHGEYITSGVAADGEDLPQGARELILLV